MLLFFIVLYISVFTRSCCNGCMATPANIAEPEIPVTETEILPCSTCPALTLQQAPDVAPGITNGVGAVTESILASGCKSYTVTCQATEGTPPVGIGGLQNNMPVVLVGPAPGPLTATLTCSAEAMIEGTDIMGNTETFRSVYCIQAEVNELCTTCTLPILPAPDDPTGTFENGMGTQVVDMVGGCTRFTVTCRATPDRMDNPDIAFGGTRAGGNILVGGPAKAPIVRQFICNNMGVVQGPDSTGTLREFDSVYCSQVV